MDLQGYLRKPKYNVGSNLMSPWVVIKLLLQSNKRWFIFTVRAGQTIANKSLNSTQSAEMLRVLKNIGLGQQAKQGYFNWDLDGVQHLHIAYYKKELCSLPRLDAPGRQHSEELSSRPRCLRGWGPPHGRATACTSEEVSVRIV